MQCTRLSAVLPLCALIVACKRPEPIRLQPTIEEPAKLVSVVRMVDPSSSGQLLRGFYPPESSSWRWAAKKFSVVLGAPAAASKDGAVLVLMFNLPDASVQALKKIAVQANIGNVELSPEEYSTRGQHEYRREVPASSFPKDPVEVDFTLDKVLSLPNDNRELGLVVTQIGLAPK